ncbi:hypothetical protein [Streptomyces griseocarneus]|uniref:hypothetical protein n=1 Tax=Streptomyces griseocarneus TaxID=51201 RepID=UPI00167DE137|nr:hypothetical protein [Streptomyces griseocarneus]MBZ6478024.1 hypothetical protein [Streptomyces griseocarneus]GHG64201.1 hypothetical protein GCM10018779_33960 [Streptomyces griseocarneus]
MSTHLEQAREAYKSEQAVLAGNRARTALAHERLALAALAAVEAGEDLNEVGRAIGLHPTNAAELIEKARQLAPALPGRPGRSPEHVIMRYAAGEISREELIETLATWPYVQAQPITEGLHDDYASFTPGSFDEVEKAANLSYIDDDTYEVILQRYALRYQ